MNSNIEKINPSRASLGIFGLIPFVAFAVLAIYELEIFGIDPRFGFTSYSAIILSFLSGALWGKTLSLDGTKPTDLIIYLSNIFSLTAWFALLFYEQVPTKLIVSVLLCGFILLLFAEHRNKRLLFGVKAQAYLKVRNTLTLVVVVAHLSLLLF